MDRPADVRRHLLAGRANEKAGKKAHVDLHIAGNPVFPLATLAL